MKGEYPEKEKEEEKPAHLDFDEIVSNQKNSQNRSDRSGGTDHGDVLTCTGEMTDRHVRQSSGYPPAEIKEEESIMPEDALHHLAKKPEKEHIEYDVKYTSMHEHVSDEVGRFGFGGNQSPTGEECHFGATGCQKYRYKCQKVYPDQSQGNGIVFPVIYTYLDWD